MATLTFPRPSVLRFTGLTKNARKESDFPATVLISQTKTQIDVGRETDLCSERRRKFTFYFVSELTFLFFFVNRYCKEAGPDPVTLKGKAAKKGLRVMFMSDKKLTGDGAQCTAMCLDGAAATTTAPTTTSG